MNPRFSDVFVRATTPDEVDSPFLVALAGACQRRLCRGAGRSDHRAGPPGTRHQQGTKRQNGGFRHAIRKKLARVFKWMHYYQLRIQNELNIADGDHQNRQAEQDRLHQGDQPRKNWQRLPSACYSKGKMLVQKTQTIKARQLHGSGRRKLAPTPPGSLSSPRTSNPRWPSAFALFRSSTLSPDDVFNSRELRTSSTLSVPRTAWSLPPTT